MKYALALGLSALSLVGCSTQSGEYNYITHTWSANRGTYVQDRVTHHRVDMKAAVSREYAGATYYFENEQNARVFDSNPWAYMYIDDQESNPFGSQEF